MRAIARRAAVDPALVHHYFTDKAHLFIETMALPLDPRAVQEAVATGGFSGERLGRTVPRPVGAGRRGRARRPS